MHTVELNLLCDNSSQQLSSPYAPPMVAVGVPLQAELIIRHSRHWDTTADADTLAKPMEFFYEIQNNPDTWLISGRKRAHFSGVDGSVETFALVLVPARPGQLSLPNVEIKCTQSADNVSCETEYKANADVVLVLPDVRSTTVRIDSLFGGEQIAA